jgi:hypothetical protein
MVAAVITTYVPKEITGRMSEEIVNCYLTTTADWYLSKFPTIVNCQCSGIGHTAFVLSITGNKIVITGTAGDRIHLRITGY